MLIRMRSKIFFNPTFHFSVTKILLEFPQKSGSKSCQQLQTVVIGSFYIQSQQLCMSVYAWLHTLDTLHTYVTHIHTLLLLVLLLNYFRSRRRIFFHFLPTPFFLVSPFIGSVR